MKYVIGAALGGLIIQGVLAYYYPACFNLSPQTNHEKAKIQAGNESQILSR